MSYKKVVELLADYKGMEASEIKPDSGLEDLGFDSLDLVEFIMTLEEEFGVTIEPNESLKTVKDLSDFIDAAKA
jgi:acyl carrier protein